MNGYSRGMLILILLLLVSSTVSAFSFGNIWDQINALWKRIFNLEERVSKIEQTTTTTLNPSWQCVADTDCPGREISYSCINGDVHKNVALHVCREHSCVTENDDTLYDSCSQNEMCVEGNEACLPNPTTTTLSTSTTMVTTTTLQTTTTEPVANHNICHNENCIQITGAGRDECTTNAQCHAITTTTTQIQTEFHLACMEGTCVKIDGAGANQCDYEGLTTNTTNCRHKVCSGGECVEVFTPGSNQCNTNQDCSGPTHYVCAATKNCVEVAGAGTDECTTNNQCH